MVLFIYRDEVYNRDNPTKERLRSLWVSSAMVPSGNVSWPSLRTLALPILPIRVLRGKTGGAGTARGAQVRGAGRRACAGGAPARSEGAGA